MGIFGRLVATFALAGCLASALGGEDAKPLAGKSLEAFIAVSQRPALEEISAAFEQKTGCRMLLHFGSSGKLLGEMELSKRGDLYLPASPDFMERAKKGNMVVADTERKLIYMVPAIMVQKGNPKGIRSLNDLAKPGLRVAIGRPDQVPGGRYAAEVLEHNRVADQVKPNIVTHAENVEKLNSLLALGTVDAIINWDVTRYLSPDKVEAVFLEPKQVARISYTSIAQATTSKEPEAAKQFIAFLVSDEGRAVFGKHHYLATEEEARKLATPETPVGGEWPLPKGW